MKSYDHPDLHVYTPIRPWYVTNRAHTTFLKRKENINPRPGASCSIWLRVWYMIHDTTWRDPNDPVLFHLVNCNEKKEEGVHYIIIAIAAIKEDVIVCNANSNKARKRCNYAAKRKSVVFGKHNQHNVTSHQQLYLYLLQWISICTPRLNSRFGCCSSSCCCNLQHQSRQQALVAAARFH